MLPYPRSTMANGGDDEVEEALAELWADWLGRRWRGKLGWSR